MPAKVESRLEPDYTNLAAAMKLAQASFPEDAAKRIVLVSDGNQNQGDAVRAGPAAGRRGRGHRRDAGALHQRAEVAVERLVLPSDIRRGQPFDLRAVVTAIGRSQAGRPAGRTAGWSSAAHRTASGWCSTRRRISASTLAPGKHVLPLRQQIDAPDFYTYEARFIPDRPEDDTMPQNNRATAFTHVRGKGQVLLIENAERTRPSTTCWSTGCGGRDWKWSSAPAATSVHQPGRVAALRHRACWPTCPARSSATTRSSMLVRNTQQMGAGLVMLGGPNSFGAGGWTNTELEEAMPVDFQVKNAKVVPRGALVMLMHASEMADGNYWQKVIARRGHQDPRAAGSIAA